MGCTHTQLYFHVDPAAVDNMILQRVDCVDEISHSISTSRLQEAHQEMRQRTWTFLRRHRVHALQNNNTYWVVTVRHSEGSPFRRSATPKVLDEGNLHGTRVTDWHTDTRPAYDNSWSYRVRVRVRVSYGLGRTGPSEWRTFGVAAPNRADNGNLEWPWTAQ